MLKLIKKKHISINSFVIFGFFFLLLAKLCLIYSNYTYVLSEMSIGQIIYYFFSVFQDDLLILWCSTLLALFISKLQRRWIKWILFFILTLIFWLYLADLLALVFFQQRFLLSSGNFISAWTNILLYYVLVFFLCIGFLTLFTYFFLKLTNINISFKTTVIILIASFFTYALPLPKLNFLWVELPNTNILSLIISQTYTITLSWNKVENNISTEKIDVPDEEMQFLLKKKERWYGLAHDDPERIFESFQTSSLTRLTDEYWNNYVFEILAEATKNKPELAFIYLDNYKDWKDQDWKSIVKDLLRIAIQYKPELAFEYLDMYENFVEDHEKIAKSLLQFAAQVYEAPLTFDQLFSENKGRENKSNVILVFLESASSVDSQKFGGLNNRMPWIDQVSNDWTAFINMHANGMSSDMGHIATLLWVEPIEFDYKGTRYENFTWYVPSLPNFYNSLWYSSIFLSTAPLSFLDQRSFLENIWYQTIIGEEAFETRPKYTFDAAPDWDLYNKALEVIQEQTWSYFLTLQTISSHTPYDTPYGHSMEAMYRYEDETFSRFYEQLKATNFFNNWILIVIGDHRKMTPLEDDEFAKRWTTAAAKIVGFIIWKNIPKNTLSHWIYQQTDLFYSLIHEFWSWEIELLNQYNDLFSKEIHRKRSIKQRYEDKKMSIADTNWHEGVIDLNRMKIVDGADDFPEDDILNYVKLSLDFQKEKLEDNGENQNNRVILISHRGITKTATENSLNAFKAAYEAWADGLEFDVSATKDWKLVVFHGPKIYGQTQCKTENRDICEMNYDEIKECLLNDWEQIMTLEEALPQIKNWFSYIFLDYKAWEGDKCNIDKERLFIDTVSLVQKNKMDAKVIFSSYDTTISKLLSKKGNVISALDTYSLADLDEIPWSYFSYFMTPAENYSDTLIQRLQRYLVDAVAYTVNDVQTLKSLQKIGVRFVMTDEFEKLKEALE